MAIVGTPQNAANGDSYTAGAGSNRVVVFDYKGKLNANEDVFTTAPTLGGVTAEAVNAINNFGFGGACISGKYFIREANILGGAQTIGGGTVGGSGISTTGNGRYTVYTLDGIDQTNPVRTSGSSNAAYTSPTDLTIALSSIVAGDIIIVGGSSRNNVGAVTFNDGSTQYLNGDNGDGAQWWSFAKTAVGTSHTASWDLVNDDFHATTAVVFAQASAASSIAAIVNHHRRSRVT